MDSYHTEAERVYGVTLTAKLSGSYNSAVLGSSLYEETYGEKKIHVFDSKSASCAESLIALKVMELEESGKYSFEEIVRKIEEYRDKMQTYFVLDNLDTVTWELANADLGSMVENMSVLAADSQSIVEAAMSKLESINLEALNRAIEDLADIVEPLANISNFFG